MPAVSEKQKRFFQWASKNPAQAAAEGKAIGMSAQQKRDFAATPEAGLPKAAPKRRRKYYGETA